MDSFWIAHYCLLLGLLSALLAGSFLAFSDFVMPGIRRADSCSGIEAMQNINRAAFKSVLLVVFIALGPMTLCLTVFVLVKDIGPGQSLIVLGSVFYLVLVFLVSVYCTIPLTKRLEESEFRAEKTAIFWDFYLRRWTLYHHIRTVGCIATAACYLLAADRCHY